MPRAQWVSLLLLSLVQRECYKYMIVFLQAKRVLLLLEFYFKQWYKRSDFKYLIFWWRITIFEPSWGYLVSFGQKIDIKCELRGQFSFCRRNPIKSNSQVLFTKDYDFWVLTIFESSRLTRKGYINHFADGILGQIQDSNILGYKVADQWSLFNGF